MITAFPPPGIRQSEEFKLIGIRRRMSLANDLTAQLWSELMPRRKEIASHSADLYLVQIYDSPDYFTNFSPAAEFEKWAAVRVNDDVMAPYAMESISIPAGDYAVFQYKGLPADAGPFFNWIYTTWFPASGYVLDTRPHFDLLGEKYRSNDPSSEEEIWIPVQKIL